MCRLLTVLFMLFCLCFTAQNTAVGNNETLVYTASYNMSGVLNDIAQVTLQTSNVNTSKATLLHLKCKAVTYSKWDNFFKIRDLYESYVNPKSLIPYLYKRDIFEGGYAKTEKYTFNHKTNTVNTVLTKKGKSETKTVSITANTKDMVATLYNLRLMDFEHMTVGSQKTFTVLFDRQAYKARITYLGKETLKTALGQKNCYKISLSSSDSKALKGQSGNLIWLTADTNKIMVYGKFKIPVGSGELKITSASGLKQ